MTNEKQGSRTVKAQRDAYEKPKVEKEGELKDITAAKTIG